MKPRGRGHQAGHPQRERLRDALRGRRFLLISETDLSERIEGRLKALPGWSAFPAELLLSCGSYEVTAKDRLLMAEAIKVADMRMYEEKKTRKRGRA